MAYRAIGTTNIDADGGSSITATEPASASSTDYLLYVVCAATSSDPVAAWPSGFTDGGIAHATPNQAGNTTVTFAYKEAGVALPGSYAVSTIATPRCMAVILAFSGRGTGAPVIALTNSAGSGGGAGPRNCTLTGVTALLNDDACWIAAASTNAATATFTPPASYTEVLDQANSNDTLAIAYLEALSAGATGNVIGTSAGGSGVDLMGILVSIPIASGGGGGAVNPEVRGNAYGGSTALRTLLTM